MLLTCVHPYFHYSHDHATTLPTSFYSICSSTHRSNPYHVCHSAPLPFYPVPQRSNYRSSISLIGCRCAVIMRVAVRVGKCQCVCVCAVFVRAPCASCLYSSKLQRLNQQQNHQVNLFAETPAANAPPRSQKNVQRLPGDRASLTPTSINPFLRTQKVL